ncbi:SCO6880 family protein [Catenuloplanes sp. NPDC051500]|uniref:SCO6880 family protein n=1 Tax=Catenuloplanes sp. NPDC051500 TaxID=3363959 RepID=UPI0037A4B07E
MPIGQERRRYGGWRRSRGMGLLGLGPAQSLTVVAAITTVAAAGAVSGTLLLAVLVPAGLLIAVTVLRWDGVLLGAGLARRIRWAWAITRGFTAYRSGVMAAHPHAWQLPGVLAPTDLLAAPAAGGGMFGVVRHRRSGTLTATLRVAASSTWLADAEQAETWVANWGSWLSGLGYQPSVRWIVVTVRTGPSSGRRLAGYIGGRTAPDAPPSARLLLQQLVDDAADRDADVETHVSVTVDPARTRPRPQTTDDALADTDRLLTGLEDSLAACGLTVLGRADAHRLAATVRAAYDPSALLDDLTDKPEDLDWGTAGPVAADEEYGCYRHDSGWSVSWAWHEAPRTEVHAEVLARLLAPGPYPLRVSLIYRPVPAGDAARLVEQEVNAAVFRDAMRAVSRRDENARERADRARALRTAQEEAAGAGVGLLSMFATVTVTDRDQLADAIAEVEARAESARIRLRRMWAGQAAGFAVTLPCGICPPQLATQWPR